MYVRWKRKPRSRRRRLTGEYSLAAVLVESHRVDGRPRQRIIKHLGSINERGIQHYYVKLDFWQSVDARLTALALDANLRAQLEEQIVQRVPRPGAREQEQDALSLAALEMRRA